MNPIRVGILGCASVAIKSFIPAIQQCPLYRLVAISSRSQVKGQAIAKEVGCVFIEGYINLVSSEEIDLVYIPLPNSIHFEWSLNALENGKHIIVEKPCVLNANDARTLVTKARMSKLLIIEHFQFLYHRQYQYLHHLLSISRLGHIRNIRIAFGFPKLADDDIRNQKELGGGALNDAGCYAIRLANSLLPHPLTIDAAQLSFDPKFEVDMYGSATMSGVNGTTAQLSWGMDNHYQCELEIWGSTGKLTANRIFTAHPTVSPKFLIESNEKTDDIKIEPDNHFVNFLKEVWNAINKNDFVEHYDGVVRQAMALEAVRNKVAALR